tara:strand:- start:650 stop:847 length:198 start_codon:yes stop_codon:yes gene_type:complete
MKKYKVNIIETNVWSTEVEANSNAEAVNKAQDSHAQEGMTFEFYDDESNGLDFECEGIKSNLYKG